MIKVGIDLLYNPRFSKEVNNSSFLDKIFHSSELRHKNKLAGIFCLKEATMKALGKKINWKEIEVKVGGKPEVRLSNKVIPKGLMSIDASISHDGRYTIGIVIMELK